MSEIMESKELLTQLQAPFKPEEIEWRVQSATVNDRGTQLLVLPYITSRSIMKRLDDVFGGFWQSNFDKVVVGNQEAFTCRLSIKIGGEWITRSDASAVSDIEAVKGGHSNALKRAAVHWGIGRYLYDLDSVWVPLKQRGKHYVNGNFKVRGNNQHLKGYFDTPSLPSWALPTGTAKQGSHQQPTQKETPPKSKSPEDQHANAIKLVEGLLQYFNTPVQFYLPLMEKTTGSRTPYKQATTEQLGKLYHAILPVKTYLDHCTKYGLTTEEVLYYAQITLKVECKDIYSLFLKMTRELCEQTLQMIREDRKLTA